MALQITNVELLENPTNVNIVQIIKVRVEAGYRYTGLRYPVKYPKIYASKEVCMNVTTTINGVQTSLTYNSTSGKWEGTITAPNTTSYDQTDHKYNVSITATDDAGSSTTVDRSDVSVGASCQLRVLEKTKPTIAVSSPSSGSRVTNVVPPIVLQLRDPSGSNGASGVNIDTFTLKIDSGSTLNKNSSGMSVNSVTGGYDITYTPQASLSQGSHSVTINVSDNDGNTAVQSVVSFTVDSVAPSLNVSAPANGYITNNATLTVVGTTNDATSSPIDVTIKVGSTDQGTVTVDGSGNFSKVVTLSEGSNTITIKSTDAAGLVTTVTRTVTLDTVPPEITAVEVIPNPVDAGVTFILKVTVE